MRVTGIVSLLIVLIVSAAPPVTAQMEMTTDDFFELGDDLRADANLMGSTVDVTGLIGTTGYNDWDFSNLSSLTPRTLHYEYVDTSDGSFGGGTIFPAAEFAQRLFDETASQYQGWLYLRQDFQGRTVYGIYDPSMSPQPEIVMDFPFVDYPPSFTFGDSWTSDYSYQQLIDVLGTPTLTCNTVHVDAQVDAWGTMQLPQIGLVNCLRVMELNTVTVQADILGSGCLPLDTITYRSYAWFAEGMDEIARITSQQYSTTVPPTGIPPLLFTTATHIQIQKENSGAFIAPDITAIDDQDLLEVDAPLSLQVTSSGTPAPTYELLSAPLGMTIGMQDGIIDWTPTGADAGAHTITIEATNGAGSDTETFVLNVVNANQPPQNLSTEFIAAGDVDLSWDPPIATTILSGYDVLRADSAAGPYASIGTTDASTTMFSDSAASPGVGNYYVVRAMLEIGGTMWSSEDSNSVFAYHLLPQESVYSQDDGSAESELIVGQLNSEKAIQFDLTDSNPQTLTKVAVYITSYIGAPLTIKVYDDDLGVAPGASLAQLTYPASSLGSGWNLLDIQPEFLQPVFDGGKFFVGVVEGEMENGVGIDENTFGHTWSRAAGGAWSFYAGGELMIRAIVEGGSVGGEQQFIRGDANASGGYDIADAVTSLDVLFSSAPVVCQAALDSNDDNAVDVADVIYTLSHLFSSGPEPAAPFPGCGVDSDPGSLTCDAFPACP